MAYIWFCSVIKYRRLFLLIGKYNSFILAEIKLFGLSFVILLFYALYFIVLYFMACSTFSALCLFSGN